MTSDDIRLAESQRAGLVEHHGIDCAEGLHVSSAFHHGSPVRRPPDGAQYGQRRAGGDAARAGNDDHGDGRAHVVRQRKGDERRCQGDVHQPCGHAVGEFLDGSARLLGFLHRVDDPAENRVGPSLSVLTSSMPD